MLLSAGSALTAVLNAVRSIAMSPIARMIMPPSASLEKRMRAYIAYAREIPRAASQIRANLRTPMPAPWIEYGSNAFGGFAQFYGNDVAAVFAGVEDPALQAQLAAANAAAATAMQALADWLVSERKHATQDYALGPQLFARMVAATEQVDVPLARLQQIGQFLR